MPPPAFDDDPGFLQRVEDLAVEQFIAKLRVEALAIAVLPRAAGLDVGRPGSDRSDPFLDGFGNELRAIVRTDVAWNAAQDEQVRETSMTSVDLSLRLIRIARHSRVNSSMTLSMRYFRPSWVRSSTKS